MKPNPTSSILSLIAFHLLIPVTLTACGNDSSSASSAGSSWSCLVTTKSHSGCCSSHSGAYECGTSQYYYDKDDRLICADQTVSPSCTR